MYPYNNCLKMSSINQNMSLFIPHVFSNITKDRIATAIELLDFGRIKRVDFVVKRAANGTNYNSVYIYFNEWYDTTFTRAFQAKIMDPTLDAKIVYDDPWFWIALENKGKRHVPGNRKLRIVINDAVDFQQPVNVSPSTNLVDSTLLHCALL